MLLLWAWEGMGADLAPDLQQRLGLPAGAGDRFVPVAASKDEGYTEEQALVNAPDIVSLEVAHVGGQRLLFKTTFAQPPDFAGAVFIIYLDLDNNPQTGRQDPGHQGVDLMILLTGDQLSPHFLNPQYHDRNTALRGARVGKALYVTLDAPLPPGGETLSVGVHLLSERQGGRSDGTPHVVAQLPRSPAQVPPLEPGRYGSIRTLDEYRYHDDLVKYERLSDKGLRAEQVRPSQPFKPGRPCPEPTFSATPRQPGKAGSLIRSQVKVSLLEEAGVDRSASSIRFGFPCPQGGLFDPVNIRLLDAQGQDIPAQFTATAFWPDDSLKWVLVDFLTALKAGEDRHVTVELGRQVKRAAAKSPLRVEDGAAHLAILTGPLRFVINKQRFNLFDRVILARNGGRGDVDLLAPGQPGMVLRDEKGQEFTSAGRPPDRVQIEQQGPLKAVVRIEGQYAAADGAPYLRYIARLTFWANSRRAEVSWTTVNDYLATEFTDLTSLTWPVLPAGEEKYGRLFLTDELGRLHGVSGRALALFQRDDRRATCTVEGTDQAVTRAPGMAECGSGRGAVRVAIQDFWQRWPKGFEWDGSRLSIHLLPPQPGPDYGRDLPHYLLFNLCEGKYRFKWGMAFTERFTVEFSAAGGAEELYAEVNRPVVAVIPAHWYAQTGALGRVAPPLEKQFAAWDKYVADSFRAYMERKAQIREYGFLNYGDWYGERGRNWGNNEYDLAHGLFQQFLRTGHRDYYRWALVAARHQADVDIVHAYPDPFYVGGMVPHSVGHTGAWSEQTEHGTWEARYDSMVTAANGHNWADGLMDAWCLSGDPVILQSALLMGEHIVWAMSPTFKALGTHERSAGWALKTILALYRQTYDPEYLAAARRIVAVALREQKFDQGGAWPHILPLDHSNGQPNVMGNNLFLIGVLLGGLQAYHEEVQDPAVERSLVAGAQWVAKSWDEGAGGWPYSATPEGKPLYPATTGLNMLIIQPLAYVAKRTSDDRLWRIVESALAAVAIGGREAFGKSLAQQLHFAGGTLALLQEWYAANRPDHGASALSGDAAWYAAMMAKTPDATRHSVRAPDEKVFYVQLQGTQAELVAVRTPHGAMAKRSPTGTLRITDAAGQEVARDTFSTDDPHESRCLLTGQAGDPFKVVIADDQRGVWTLQGDGLKIVMQTVPGFHIGGVGRGRYHFLVPAGTPEFRIKLLGVHPGAYGAVVLTPDGQVAGQHQDINPGAALPPTHPERGEVVVEPAAEDTGKLWSVVLWAAGDIGVELVGVPPYLSLSAEAWFEPKP